jgi:hypothetical protein
VSEWTPERLDALASKLLDSPHIAELSGGAMGSIATYLPGRRIPGLRVVDNDKIEIHVVMAWGSSVDDVEAGVVRALEHAAQLASLHIEDVAAPRAAPAALETAARTRPIGSSG